MAKKTNKTDHVLNLLSGGGPKNEAENNKEAGPAPPVIPEGTVSVVESVDEDGQIADTIRKSLEQELEKMERVPASQVTVLKSASEIHSPLDVEKPETEETPGKVVNKPIEEMAAESRAPEAAKTAAESRVSEAAKAAMESRAPETAKTAAESKVPESTRVPDKEELAAANKTMPQERPETANRVVPETVKVLGKEDVPKTVDKTTVEVKPELVSEVPEEIQAPVSEAAEEIKAPVSEAAEEIKGPVSEAAEEIQAPVSEAAEEIQAPASKGAEELAKKETETPATEFKDVQKSAENGLSRVEAPETKFILVNVMERLVQEKAHYYMEQFGVCTCPRCTADVTALALTKLPPKYVVVNKEAVSPLINFYSNKYAGQITVEITKACIRVGENPYHSED